MKKTSLLLLLLFVTAALQAQKKTTTSAFVSFDASTPKDALPKAENKTVIGSLDTQTGAVAFEVAVNNFVFSNPRMQEHFNGANWMNSEQYPKFTYTGTIDKIKKVKFDQNGTYDVKAEGTMTVKGISKPVKAEGKITVADGRISVSAGFSIKLEDFGVTGQPIDNGKVAKEPSVTVVAQF